MRRIKYVYTFKVFVFDVVLGGCLAPLSLGAGLIFVMSLEVVENSFSPLKEILGLLLFKY